MPRELRAASCLRKTWPITNNQQHIWISDALLTDTFDHFARRGRRCGSNVPGPLEARRRAAKRRNTNLAHAGYGHTLLEPAIVLGTGSPSSWWQLPQKESAKSQKKPAKPRLSIFPTWLFTPSQNADSKTEGNSHASEAQIQEAMPSKKRKKKFLQHIRNEPTVTATHQALKDWDLNLLAQPELAELAFKCILEASVADKNLIKGAPLDFITDPVLNPPGSQVHSILLESLCAKSPSTENWQSDIWPALLTSVRLGILDDQAMRDLIEKLPQIEVTSGLSIQDHGKLPIREWIDVLRALRESKVMEIGDLDRKFLRDWRYKVECVWFMHDFAEIASFVTMTDNAIGLTDEALATNLVYSSLRSQSDESDGYAKRLTNQICSLPNRLQAPVVFRTSIKLVENLRAKRIAKNRQTKWQQVLCSLQNLPAQRLTIDKNVWDSSLNACSTLSFRQKLLTLVWTVGQITVTMRQSGKLLDSIGIHDTFHRVFATKKLRKRIGMDAITQIMITADSLPLRDKSRIFRDLQWLTEHNLIHVCGEKVFEKQIEAITTKRNLEILLDDDFYHWAGKTGNEALSELLHTVNKDLSILRHYCRTLVRKDTTAALLVRRVIEHNLPFKHSICCWRSDVNLHRDRLPPGEGEADPAEAIGLIYDAVSACAVSPFFTPRQAFRNVYFFFILLHRYGGPIDVRMSRALWYSAVIRYGDKGPSETQLKWCLAQVEMIEGPGTARKLVYSHGFSKKQFAPLLELTRRIREEEMKVDEDAKWWLPERLEIEEEGELHETSSASDSLQGNSLRNTGGRMEWRPFVKA